MNYPVKCTFCMPLLLNLKKYQFAHYYQNSGQWYMDVESVREQELIARLEQDQLDTFDTYKDLEYITEENVEQ